MTAVEDGQALKRRVFELEAELERQKAYAQHLQTQQDLLAPLFENICMGITVWGQGGELLMANTFFTELTGYSTAEISDLNDLFKCAFQDDEYRDHAAADWHTAALRPHAIRQFKVTCKDGAVKDIEFRGARLPDDRHLLILADVTAFKQLETQLIQSQKMEALGTLAGGIAHDYNNMLMGMHGNLSLVLLDFDGPRDQLAQLKNIESYIQSGVNLTQQLLSLARGGHFQAKPVEINALIRQTADIFSRTKKQITIQNRLSPYVKTVEVDPSQMEQVFLNLLINAWQAMPDGGAVTLRSRNVILDVAFTEAYHVPPGEYVQIAVSDTGIGMDAATIARVFDPFFTTKGNAAGTGLGLSSAYNIVKNHAGIITVDSRPGHGACFTLYLPVSSKTVHSTAADKEAIIEGRGTILLVDDEPMILDVGRQMLQQLGYTPLTAESGKAAIELYHAHMHEIRLVILDIIMPDLSGVDTLKRLSELNPEIKVLLASGYSVDGEAQKMLEMGGKAFIQKPFSLGALSQMIHTISGHP